jgi:hypothetical protein
MRPRLFALSCLVILFHSTTHVKAQVPAFWDQGPTYRGVAPAAEAAPPPGVLLDELPRLETPDLAVGQQQRFGVEALLGIPTGVRGGWAVWRRNKCSFQVEGFVGTLLPVPIPFLFVLPMAGGGGRFNFTLCSGERNALVLSPGLDVYSIGLIPFGAFGGGGAALLSPEVQCTWFHSFGRCGLDLGLNLMLPFALTTGRFAPFPFPSGVIGFRF